MVGNRWLCKGKLSFDIADTYGAFLPRQKFQYSHTYGMADALRTAARALALSSSTNSASEISQQEVEFRASPMAC